MDQELMDANEKKLIEDKIMNILASPNFSYDNDHALGPNLCVSYVLSIRFFSPGNWQSWGILEWEKLQN